MHETPGMNTSERQDRRVRLLREIEAEIRETGAYTGRMALAREVIDAMAKVEREEFVSPYQAPLAYENRPLPIGYGQTISQPYVVALMTDLLELAPEHRVLEVGTGSGYQTAILAMLARQVHTIERVDALADQARFRLKRLGYDTVEVHNGDGYEGLVDHAPFDAIIVTAAAKEIPPPLIEQLKPGGRMVIPVGGRFSVQNLVLVEKDETGEIKTTSVLPVAFVPLKHWR
ncbi:MAG: protein-L-isoaspartate(D-aspartate) O-methyltransferase [Alphaproteobacteria bacterium]|nr:protein-L-isoaspartate(D-aspartate) O-methyltransferase [Alphaproteobacteria bacterium]